MPKDRERLEFWQISGSGTDIRVRHRIAVFHDNLSWAELAPEQVDRNGAPVDHEWIIWSEDDYTYANGDRRHYWTWSRGGTDSDFKRWLKRVDGVPRTDIYYDYDPARLKAWGLLQGRLDSLRKDVERTMGAVRDIEYAVAHDCIPLPAQETV